MAQNTLHAALFDLDGVLIDSEPTYTQIWSDIDSAFPTGIDNFAIKIKGCTLDKILSTYYPDPTVQPQVCRMLALREQQMDYPLFPGVMEFLNELKQRGIPTAIVTSSGDKKMQRLFQANPEFHSCFDVVITDAQVTHSKPHPEGYILAARAIGADPADCFVFEDSINGIKAGRAAGATVIALDTTNPADLLRSLADSVIAGFVSFSVDDMLAVSKL